MEGGKECVCVGGGVVDEEQLRIHKHGGGNGTAGTIFWVLVRHRGWRHREKEGSPPSPPSFSSFTPPNPTQASESIFYSWNEVMP